MTDSFGLGSALHPEMCDPSDRLSSCSVCSAQMRLVTSLPADGDLPELRGFKCSACGNVTVKECRGEPKVEESDGSEEGFARISRAAYG